VTARALAFGRRVADAFRALAWFEIWGLLNFFAGMIAMAVCFIVPDLAKLAFLKFLAWVLS
jgi:hypothetical protein